MFFYGKELEVLISILRRADRALKFEPPHLRPNLIPEVRLSPDPGRRRSLVVALNDSRLQGDISDRVIRQKSTPWGGNSKRGGAEAHRGGDIASRVVYSVDAFNTDHSTSPSLRNCQFPAS